MLDSFSCCRARLSVAVLLLLACAAEGVAQVPAAARSSRVIRVPTDYPTVQLAVDAARSGDLVLLASGVYRESVRIARDSVVLRGLERDGVIFDGEYTRAYGVLVEGRGVAVENLTLRHFTEVGVRLAGALQFRLRGLASYNNGGQGIAILNSTDGLLEESFVSGAVEAGVLIESCSPCRVQVRRVIGEHSGIGLLARDAGGDLEIRESTWRLNRAGVVLMSSAEGENVLPQLVSVRGNLFQGNHSRTAPGLASTAFAWGNGLVIAGGRQHRIDENAFAFHAGHGVLIAPVGPSGAVNLGMRVGENTFAKSGRADVSIGGPHGTENCVTMSPSALRTAPRALSCGAILSSLSSDDLVPWLTVALRNLRHANESYPDWKSLSAPAEVPIFVGDKSVGWAIPASPSLVVTAVTRPAESDSVMSAARQRAGPPIHVSPLGLRLAAIQANLPVTRGALVLGAVVVLLSFFVTRRRLLSLALGLIYAGWAGLALVVALLLSSI